jgi:SAM-dependent methyltransferase
MGGSSAVKIERIVTDKASCDFYHDVNLPSGRVEGQWDLRANADQYLGHVDFAGKRVIDIGPASGFLSFHMERRGAQVVCIEPPMETFWDLVPRAGVDLDAIKQGFAGHIERIRNSFRYAHTELRSKVQLYEASAYDLPDSLGSFDIGVLGCVLLHCSCPVRIVEQVARRVQTIIIAEPFIDTLTKEPACWLIPSSQNQIVEAWWRFSPMFFTNYLEVLGFK